MDEDTKAKTAFVQALFTNHTYEIGPIVTEVEGAIIFNVLAKMMNPEDRSRRFYMKVGELELLIDWENLKAGYESESFMRDE